MSKSALISATIDGVQTDVLEVGEITPLAFDANEGGVVFVTPLFFMGKNAGFIEWVSHRLSLITDVL